MPIHFQLSQGEAWFPVPASVLPHLQEATAEELRILLLLLHLGRSATQELVCERLGVTEAQLAAAVERWLDRGVFSMEGRFVVLTPPQPPLGKPVLLPKTGTRRPTYGLDAVSSELDKNPPLRSALRAAQTILNRQFSQTEYEVLYSLYDYYGLQPETILLLMSFCVERGRTSLKAIESMADEWHRRGIVTPDEAEAFLADERRRSGAQAMVRRLFGLGNRRLTPKELTYIARWTETFSFGEELLDAAYNRCVDATGKLSFAYIDAILTAWHAKGLTTAEQALAEPAPPRRSGKKKKAQEPSSDSKRHMQEFTEWAFRTIYADGAESAPQIPSEGLDFAADDRPLSTFSPQKQGDAAQPEPSSPQGSTGPKSEEEGS